MVKYFSALLTGDRVESFRIMIMMHDLAEHTYYSKYEVLSTYLQDLIPETRQVGLKGVEVSPMLSGS